MSVPQSETRLDQAALASLLASGTGWTRDGGVLTKTFTFKGFKGAVAFVNRVADAANAANHHPDVHLERYKTVRVVLTTHIAHGLTDADVDLARRIDQAEQRPPSRADERGDRDEQRDTERNNQDPAVETPPA